jgi:hypothetical protein
VTQLWDIGRTLPRDKYSEDEVQGEIEQYRPRFKDNHRQDIPRHPYKIYREIVENQELNDLERAALHHLKEEYSKKWKQKKQRKVKNQ